MECRELREFERVKVLKPLLGRYIGTTPSASVSSLAVKNKNRVLRKDKYRQQ
jgi:hypothetical protein